MSLINSISSGFGVSRLRNTNNIRKNYVSLSTPQDTCSFSGKKGDIEPNNPLNRYKPDVKFFGRFDCMNPFWRQKNSSNSVISPWKLHIYSDNIRDYRNLYNTIAPYLMDKDVTWKTLSYDEKMLMLPPEQKGKAFTIYPSSNRQMAQIAQDIDYIIRNNDMTLKNNEIKGDREMGNSGRIFYRYQYNTGALKDTFFDVNDSEDEKLMRLSYDANRGADRYLANDMTKEDDIWYNFDPSYKPSTAEKLLKPDFDAFKYCEKVDGKYILEKDLIYPITGEETICLPDRCEIDLSDPELSRKLAKLHEGDSFKIGRNPDCDLRLNPNASHISRNHVNIYRIHGRLCVQDISTNGTAIKKPEIINGQKVSKVESCKQIGDSYLLAKTSIYPLEGISTIIFPDCILDMNSTRIKDELSQMPDDSMIKIGRASECNISINPFFTSTSRYHANIYKKDGQYFIQDISTYGTKLQKSNQ